MMGMGKFCEPEPATMRRVIYVMGLIFMTAFVGCGSDSVEPSANKSSASQEEHAAAEAGVEIVPRFKTPPPSLPDAEVPVKRLFAKSFINKPAPEFVVEEWLTKQPDREGKMVLIDFWATWCGPCLEAIPKLNQFHRKHKDRLVVVGVSDEPADTVREHRGAKMHYFVAVDPKRRMANALEIRNIPHVILVDPWGIVRWEGFPLQDGHELTEEVLDDLLDTYVLQ